ncbi:hypothetical protein EJ02DRAFT_370399 [Clathrospora elynae]|uniref:Pre-mRNA-splicing factor 38B n=1 Tax=Clathrospora elynae TaxID=706981 RepID=A0A6A5SZ10_9PLEO|nr:hypothetical protein EJ02DRAFT_370399 [Clathrospora elynae]
MTGDIDDDEYVAGLLKQDAKNVTKKYELVGIDAFNPRRMKSGAPKPNTSFLRHIIRQTDSHNATLLAKEAEESSARLKIMDRERTREKRREEDMKQRKAEGRLTPTGSNERTQQTHSTRERDHSRDMNERDTRRRQRDQDDSRGVTSHRHRDRSRDAQRRKRRHVSEEEDRSRRKRRRSTSPRDRVRGRKESDTKGSGRANRRDHNGDGHRRRRSYSRSASPLRSPSPRSDRHTKRRKHRDRSHSPRLASRSPRRERVPSDSYRKSQRSKRRAGAPASDSDPLEAIVGPLPPLPLPTVRSRGRGAHKANLMGIESRFSSTYDPSIDIRADSDVEDDWGDALEVLRDRARWQQQGADRLKAAGFTDEEVKKWEKGDVMNEDDVVWTGKGQAREWDRGKVFDEAGDVELRADFGRLK